ncbi:DMT family transporter [Falsihalocynthiibacter arcticus]|uniref:EamA domain-containing protein n=1 Tax=Falsihalocynthiibacter arcticus TaxID=1579316 RepID=A0A126UV57_9RHOB|nr:DMT family transporter [Falsihalocynthiibacter arcticus]AML49938.1 hypothetical protein RC74_00370 [Falsihalocynthiibacter arcticus]
MSQDRPLLGILLIIGFCILAPLGDAMAKLLGGSNGVIELVAYRFIIQSLIVVPIVLFARTDMRASPRVLGFTFLRTSLHIASTIMLFIALRYIPLAETLAIVFIMPIIMMFLGWFFLNETVGPRRILAAGVAFFGTMLVIQPSFALVGMTALLPIGVAFAFAVFMIITRVISREVDPMALQAFNGIVGVALVVPLWFVGAHFGWTDFQITTYVNNQWGIIILMGGIGTVAHLLMTWSLRFAPSSTLAPMQYLEIPIATVYGFLLFNDLPNGVAALGITIVISSGLYIIYRESRLASALQAAE